MIDLHEHMVEAFGLEAAHWEQIAAGSEIAHRAYNVHKAAQMAHLRWLKAPPHPPCVDCQGPIAPECGLNTHRCPPCAEIRRKAYQSEKQRRSSKAPGFAQKRAVSNRKSAKKHYEATKVRKLREEASSLPDVTDGTGGA